MKFLSIFFRYFHITLLLGVGLFGCASYQLPNVPLTNISTYNTYQGQNGLGVAFDIFYDKDRLLQFFGADLLHYGIFPIYIIIENNDSNPYIVEEQNFILLGDSKVIRPETPTHASSQIIQEQYDVDKGVLVAGSVAPCLIAFASPALMKHQYDLDTIRYNLFSKQLVSSTVYKNDLSRGFLYFPLKQIISGSDSIVLEAKFKKLSTEDIYIFKFNIDIKKIKKTANKLKKLRKSIK